MLDLEPRDIVREHQVLVVRHGKGDRQRPCMVDDWGWREIMDWAVLRESLPDGKLICKVKHPGAGTGLSSAFVRQEMRRLQRHAKIRKRCAPHQLRHGFSVEFNRETGDMLALHKQLGHARFDTTMIYLRSIDTLDVLAPVKARKPPMVAVR